MAVSSEKAQLPGRRCNGLTGSKKHHAAQRRIISSRESLKHDRKFRIGAESLHVLRPKFNEDFMSLDEKRFPELIRKLYALVSQREEMFPGRPFTPDGHVIGSLAECFAQYHFELSLYACSNAGHDAHIEGCNVEIKVTQRDRVALRSGPDRLLAFPLEKDGSFEEVYDEPGAPVWSLVADRKRQVTASTKSVYRSFANSCSRFPSSSESRGVVARELARTRLSMNDQTAIWQLTHWRTSNPLYSLPR
jgi:hypothetical protein